MLFITFQVGDFHLSEQRSDLGFKKDVVAQDSKRPQYVKDERIRKSDGYVFRGWYLDPSCTIPADLETGKVEAKHMVFYAKWTPPTVIVRFHRTGFINDPIDDDSLSQPFERTYIRGRKIEDDVRKDIEENPDKYSSKPQKLLGTDLAKFNYLYYYTDNGNKVKFDLDTQLMRPVYDLYPRWALDYIEVTYYPEDSDEPFFLQRLERDSYHRFLTYDRFMELAPGAPISTLLVMRAKKSKENE